MAADPVCSLCGAPALRDRGARRHAYCENCGGLERHRAVGRLFADLLENGAGRRALEVGPASEYVFGGYLRQRGWSYESLDQSRSGHPNDPRHVAFIDHELDLTDLSSIADDRFDLVIVQHVIEEIPEYERALDEIARVTAPGGIALLEIPWDPQRPVSERQPANHFGNVWLFGADLPVTIERRFAEVEDVEFREDDFRGRLFRCARPVAASPPQPGSGAYAQRVATVWGERRDEGVRSFWQSPVVMSELNRRITGDPEVEQVEFFRDRFCPQPRRSALSLGSGSGHLEIRMVTLGVCDRMLGVDISEARVQDAFARIPADLTERVTFRVVDLEHWQPDERFDLVVAQDVLHHVENPDAWCARINALLTDDGLAYVHDFIGPPRFQWTDRQLRIINRLLERLPERLRYDVVNNDGSLREPVGRPDRERFIAADPSEAIAPREIPAALERHLEPVLVKPYGGAIFHQLFNRIMGNFVDDEDIVRLLMEVDFLLTDEGTVEPDYLWGVYRRRSTVS